MMDPAASQTRIFVTLTAILGACFFCGALPAMVLINDPGLTGDIAAMVPTRRPTATPTVTRTPTATFTPRPTFTPRATRLPTVTPRPAPVNRPGPAAGGSLSVGEYATTVARLMEVLSQSMENVGRLTQNPRLEDDNWLAQMAASLALIREVHNGLVDLDPPPEMASTHRSLLDATADCSRSVDFMISGIDNRDERDIAQAGALVESCGEKLRSLSSRLEVN